MNQREREELLVKLGRAAGAAETVSKLIGSWVRGLPEDWTPHPGDERQRAAEAFERSWQEQQRYFEAQIQKLLDER